VPSDGSILRLSLQWLFIATSTISLRFT